MNLRTASTITSLLLALLLVVHWAEDVVRAFAPGGFASLFGVAILAVWLYPALALAGRRGGYIVLLIGSLGSVGVLALHTSGAGMVGGRIVGSGGIPFWVFSLVSLGATGAFGGILSLHGLWTLRRG